MNRRHLLTTAAALTLTACAGELPTLPVAVTVALPPEIKAVIDDATAIVAKVESLGTSVKDTAGSLIEKVKTGIAALTSGTGDTKTVVGMIVSALTSVATLLPQPYGTIALAIETLLPVIGGAVGMRMAARRPTGMSPAQARLILRT